MNILLADDHVIIRTGLKRFILSCIPGAIIDEAFDGDSAFAKIKASNYQLIILDINMPNTDSFGLLNNIMVVKPDANILIFSMNAEEIYARKYLQLGAKGYLSKAAPESEIQNALNTVISGKRYISPGLNESFAEAVIGKRSENPFDKLSPREFEIVLHLIKGESLGSICKTLALQTSTVGTHKARIFEKLQCSNIIDINALAKLYNIIPNF